MPQNPVLILTLHRLPRLAGDQHCDRAHRLASVMWRRGREAGRPGKWFNGGGGGWLKAGKMREGRAGGGVGNERSKRVRTYCQLLRPLHSPLSHYSQRVLSTYIVESGASTVGHVSPM